MTKKLGSFLTRAAVDSLADDVEIMFRAPGLDGASYYEGPVVKVRDFLSGCRIGNRHADVNVCIAPTDGES